MNDSTKRSVLERPVSTLMLTVIGLLLFVGGYANGKLDSSDVRLIYQAECAPPTDVSDDQSTDGNPRIRF